MEEDGSGSGRSVGAGEERLQAEWTAHPVCAGRGHRLPAGLLPQGQAALRAGQLVKMHPSSTPLPQHTHTHTSFAFLTACVVCLSHLSPLYPL